MKVNLTLLLLLFFQVGNAQVEKVTKIDAEKIYQFSEGMAIIRKGNSYAVIDARGKFIIDYNQYKLADFNVSFQSGIPGFVNGYCIVQSLTNNLFGYVDKQGKLVIPCIYYLADNFDEEGWTYVTDKNHKNYYLNAQNDTLLVPDIFLEPVIDNGSMLWAFGTEFMKTHRISGKRTASKFKEGLSIGTNKTRKKGFYSREGKMIIEAKYTYLSPFSEGLALAGKEDEFGRMYYGYINKKGDVVIPFQYSKQPGNFSNGLAYVTFPDKQEFDFAFINKMGQVLYPQSGMIPVDGNKPAFINGYFSMIIESEPSFLRIIDTLGSVNSIITKLQSKIQTVDFLYNDGLSYYRLNGNIQFFDYLKTEIAMRIGFVNIDNGQVVYTDFQYIAPFDLTSGLSVSDDMVNVIDKKGNIVMQAIHKNRNL